MSSFFASMVAELGARRKRLRGAIGDRGQGLFEMLALGGFVVGSLGLLLSPRLAAASPWGFAVPFVFVAAYLFLDARRQAVLARGAEEERVRKGHDWLALGLTIVSAAAGAAAFVLAFTQPEPPPPPDWQPPSNAVSVDIAPGP